MIQHFRNSYSIWFNVTQFLQQYLSWSYIWAENREEQILEFVNQNPLIQEIREEFMKYDNRAQAIADISKSHYIGAIQVEMGR